MIPPPHVVAINGIRTDTDAISWPKRLRPFLESRHVCTVESHYYRTGPFPPWNLWAVNPRIARVLASSIEARMEEIGIHPLHLVAHSNGTNIALALAKSLAARGIRVNTMVLIGSALDSDVERSGLAALISAGVVVHERPNPAEPIPLDLGTEILGEVNAGLLARIAELEAALAAALNGSPIETPDLLAALDEAFETHVPEALRAQFEPAWVTVRNLLQSGKIGRAAAFVRALPVPAELEPAREQIATMIDGGA